MIFQAPRGTYDRMPDQQRLWQRINKVLEEISDSYGYDRIDTPVIEVHISNIYSREKFRQKSLLSANCKAVICGFGLDSYKAGLSTL